MTHHTSATRPTNLNDAPIHFANFTYKGGGLCEHIRDRDFGALWDGPEGLPLTHLAGSGEVETNFRFTMVPRFVTCEECLLLMGRPGLLKDPKKTLQDLLGAIRDFMENDDSDGDIIEAAGPWIEAGCPGLEVDGG